LRFEEKEKKGKLVVEKEKKSVFCSRKERFLFFLRSLPYLLFPFCVPRNFRRGCLLFFLFLFVHLSSCLAVFRPFGLRVVGSTDVSIYVFPLSPFFPDVVSVSRGHTYRMCSLPPFFSLFMYVVSAIAFAHRFFCVLQQFWLTLLFCESSCIIDSIVWFSWSLFP